MMHDTAAVGGTLVIVGVPARTVAQDRATVGIVVALGVPEGVSVGKRRATPGVPAWTVAQGRSVEMAVGTVVALGVPVVMVAVGMIVGATVGIVVALGVPAGMVAVGVPEGSGVGALVATVGVIAVPVGLAVVVTALVGSAVFVAVPVRGMSVAIWGVPLMEGVGADVFAVGVPLVVGGICVGNPMLTGAVPGGNEETGRFSTVGVAFAVGGTRVGVTVGGVAVGSAIAIFVAGAALAATRFGERPLTILQSTRDRESATPYARECRVHRPMRSDCVCVIESLPLRHIEKNTTDTAATSMVVIDTSGDPRRNVERDDSADLPEMM